MAKFIDISGQRFHRLVAIKRLKHHRRGHTVWLCQCDCGKKTEITLDHWHRNKSCGCILNADKITHGHTRNYKVSPQYLMWSHASRRARKKGQKFTIVPDDIRIPRKCPLLGIPLLRGKGAMHGNSPTLDRIICKHGYTPQNIWVISARANAIKSDASLDELKRLVRNLEKRTK